MFRLQLGIVADFADKSGSTSNMELRPMLSIVPPLLPIYGRAILVVSNILDRAGVKREIAYGAALGLRIGTPSIGAFPAIGIFAEVGALPRSRDFGTEPNTESKTVWVFEGRAGAYLDF
jgi:hypothetical protein